MHSISTKQVLRKGQKVYILTGVLNFQRVRNLLGVPVPFVYFFYLKEDLTSHIEDPL